MRIVAFIEEGDVIRRILEYLNLWDVSARPPPKLAMPPPETILVIDEETAGYEDTQVIEKSYLREGRISTRYKQQGI
jgi:hypothetical protein